MKTPATAIVFGFAMAISVQSVGGDREDYAGLPLNEDTTAPAVSEVIVQDEYAGYDGLPVTRMFPPTFVSVELVDREGYDGLSTERPLGHESWAFED